MPPYVSTMILRPVRPQSPIGPPITKLPVGLTWNLTGFPVRSRFGSSGRMTCSITSARIFFWLTESACCVLSTTVSMRTGFPPSYSTVTWVLPSGRR